MYSIYLIGSLPRFLASSLLLVYTPDRLYDEETLVILKFTITICSCVSSTSCMLHCKCTYRSPCRSRISS